MIDSEELYEAATSTTITHHTISILLQTTRNIIDHLPLLFNSCFF